MVRGLILLYHRIETTGHDPFDLSVSAELFGQHFEVVAEAGTIVDLHEMLTLSPENLPERPVALTFDDGYSGHLSHVLPVLERLSLRQHSSSRPRAWFKTPSTGGTHWSASNRRRCASCTTSASM